ncbi:MAG: hypothetical protein VW982_04650 [Candidatus Poseidoniales archaeon]
MAVYPSPFGVLNEEGRFDDTTNDEIEAELRGLSLLDSILMTTEAWEKTACSITGHTLLVTKTDGYELRIDVVRTVESFLITGDHHLQVHILKGRNRSVGAVERVCIHHDMSYPNCAIADALISLVLLGESNWPQEATPHTLREFSHAAKRTQIAQRFKLGIIELTQEDLDEIQDIREAMEWGIAYAALDMLCGFARRCYTCKGMEIENVRLHTQGLFDEIDRQDVLAYAANPSTPSDLLFLPEFARPN